MSSHLRAEDRETLEASLLALSTADSLLPLIPAEQESAVQAVIAAALSNARLRLAAEDGQQRLDRFLAEWIESAATVGSGFAKGAAGQAVRDYLASLESAATSLRCDSCPGPAHELCNHAATTETVAAGACLRDVVQLFEFASDVSRRLYATAGIAQGRVGSVRIELSTIRAGIGKSRLVADIGVDARCDPVDGTDASVVELALPLHDLNIRAMNATLYVLLHEIVVHGYQRVEAARRKTGRTDPFSEGLMDLVASRVFRKAFDDPSLTSRVNPAWVRDPTPGLEVWSARARAFPELSAHVRLGREVGARLLWAFTAVTGAPGDGPFQRLACSVNVLDLTSEQRIRLVHKLARVLEPFGRPLDPAAPGTRLVERYLRDDDAQRLVRELLQ